MNAKQLDIYDITIIGGGPAGMYAAFYSGMRAMRTKLIDAKEELGGFMRTYPEKLVWDVGGVDPIRCERLIDSLEKQARTFDPTLVLGQEIAHMERQDDIFILTSKTGGLHYTRTILLCAGRGMTQVQKLDIEGANRYELNNLHYTVTDLSRFKDQRVLISGGGDSAVDWANEIVSLAKQVIVVHRRNEFTAHELPVAQMKTSATVMTPYSISRLYGVGERIGTVALEHAETGEIEQIEVDEVIVSHGFDRDFGDLLNWGLDKEDYGVSVDQRMRTSIPGIFGAGDFITYGSKVRLIAGAFNDAVLAVNSAKLYLDPSASDMAGVSSHNARFFEKNKAIGNEACGNLNVIQS
ncbi:thioredoxin reductase [Paenibacillus sp. VTT E-133280]|uniref:NAD(P)/FAD-dependent oxidoreductase n=1 Tax=Paenibacillus TaxID=44249 RepID=UPI000BA13876|nr:MULTISPECIES: NAD(P)/FAD-dependent oxidoreductase [unclassified Paenibacillus]MDH6369313.1 thioredoxin reductase [Paenibacillus sp. PastF-3]OZQ68625.1 thioredoxin reductase [Paenibacillus sp. VTT E-133280]